MRVLLRMTPLLIFAAQDRSAAKNAPRHTTRVRAWWIVVPVGILLCAAGVLALLLIPKISKVNELFDAIERNDAQELSSILENDSTLARETMFGLSTLHSAVESRAHECLVLLLKSGANPDAEWFSLTPLSEAIDIGDASAVHILLVHGANSNKRVGKLDDTPLMLAVYTGSEEMVIDLLNHGAKVQMENKLNENALNVAVDNKREEIRQILLRYYPQGTPNPNAWRSSG